MSIVKHLPETPKDGSVVYADNGKFSSDRAIYSEGKFNGGGEFPVRSYEMTQVSKWFYLNKYSEWYGKQGINGYSISFNTAESINEDQE